jgi:dTDP-4-dehydrorhamnose reductase
VINAAAYTAVDRAETEVDAAFALNRDAPAAMARACAARNMPFVHFSTDYVFAGDLDRALRRDRPHRPAGVYGASKLAGEQAVQAAGGRWAQSCAPPGSTAPTGELREDHDAASAVDREELERRRRPARPADLGARGAPAPPSLTVDSHGRRRGRWPASTHLSGAGDASWADLAAAVFEQAARRGGPTARVLKRHHHRRLSHPRQAPGQFTPGLRQDRSRPALALPPLARQP